MQETAWEVGAPPRTLLGELTALPPGAPTQIRKWGDKFGERSEPKKFLLLGGIIPPPETAILTLLSYEQMYNICIF